ncbi:MAG: glucan-binding protein [Bacillota bacterium]|nr:glucan-binding protein [Bacillota bacterium]
MRKQTKYVAVLSAAALLAMGASMTSFAAGWEKDEAGAWHYYDKDDDMVTNQWEKDGGKWFYLDDDGNMVSNQWVEDEYYVGEDGAMITNGWVKTLADDEDVNDPEDTGEHWYYFGAKGKKVTTSKKTINGKTYHFNDEGKMLSGWQDDNSGNVYYLGSEDEGWETKNQWRWLEKPGLIDDEEDSDGILGKNVFDDCSDDDNCDDEGWYWFDGSGKLYKKIGVKTIKGRKFIFNKHGQMLYEWINGNKVAVPSTNAQLDGNLADGEKATIGEMLWYKENGDSADNGSRYKGWQYLSGSQDTKKDGDSDWYFFKDGKAKHANPNSEDFTYLYKDNDAKDKIYRKKEKLSWDGKTGTFCFDENGAMKKGLQFIDMKTYYFNDDGYMQTGKVSGVEEADGDTFNYYFNTKNSGKGQGYTGEKDGYLYFNGKRCESDDDYRIFKIGNNYYVVNSKGKCQKTLKNKDLEVADGTLEKATIGDKGKLHKDYTVSGTEHVYIEKKDDEGRTVSVDQGTVASLACVPHIQLDETLNYIIPDNTTFKKSIVVNEKTTHNLKKNDFLTAKLAYGVATITNTSVEDDNTTADVEDGE